MTIGKGGGSSWAIFPALRFPKKSEGSVAAEGSSLKSVDEKGVKTTPNAQGYEPMDGCEFKNKNKHSCIEDIADDPRLRSISPRMIQSSAALSVSPLDQSLPKFQVPQSPAVQMREAVKAEILPRLHELLNNPQTLSAIGSDPVRKKALGALVLAITNFNFHVATRGPGPDFENLFLCEPGVDGGETSLYSRSQGKHPARKIFETLSEILKGQDFHKMLYEQKDLTDPIESKSNSLVSIGNLATDLNNRKLYYVINRSVDNTPVLCRQESSKSHMPLPSTGEYPTPEKQIEWIFELLTSDQIKIVINKLLPYQKPKGVEKASLPSLNTLRIPRKQDAQKTDIYADIMKIRYDVLLKLKQKLCTSNTENPLGLRVIGSGNEYPCAVFPVIKMNNLFEGYNFKGDLDA